MPEQECRSGEIICQRYRVDRLLGRGVLGEAYACRDMADGNTRVVVKALRSKGRQAVDALGPEIARLTRLRHPGLVRVLGFGTLPDGVSPFAVEQYLEGRDLLEATRKSSVPEIIRILADVCRALAYLHDNGVTHRCLKPGNGMVVDVNGDLGRVRLLHYGLLQFPLIPAELASAGALVYVAPELLYGHAPDPASDLYALGVLAYQLLTRRLPFEDDDQGYLVQKHLQGRVDTKLLDRLEWGPALGQIIRSLLDRDPNRRPSSAQEVLRLLRVATGSDLGSECSMPVDSYFVLGAYVGRTREMSLLQDRAAKVHNSGRGWTVFITGESGSGKTRCMEEFRVWGVLNGWRVLDASCSAGDEKTYAPYRQLLATMDRLCPASSAAGKEVIFRFEDLPKAEPPGRFENSADSAAGQFRDSLTREVVRRLADRPTILLLHDFHWSDEATTAVLDYLTSDITSQCVLVCVSLRPGAEAPAAISRLVEQCCRQSRAEVMPLEPLTESDVRELIAGLTGQPEIGGLLGERLYRASGGNPLFLEETLKHLVDKGLLRRQFGKWQADRDILEHLDVPAGIAVLIKERLGQLSTGAAELARWLAVFQRSVSADLVRLAARHSVQALDASIGELLAKHLVRSVEDSGEQRLEFRHTLVAEVVTRSTPVRRRRSMHLAIAEALETHFDGEKHIQELALHYTEGGGGEKALQYAMRAASMYRSEFANQSALRLYEYMLRNPGSMSVEQLCQVAMQASDACCALGLPKQAVRLIKARLATLGKGNGFLRAELLACLANAFRHSGDVRNMVTACRLGLRILATVPATQSTYRTKIIFTSYLAFFALIESRPRKGISLISGVLRSTQSDASLSGMLYSMLSALYRVQCRLREAVRASQMSIDLLKSANSLHYLPVAHSHLGAYLNALGRFSQALVQHETAVEISARTRSVFQQAQALSNLAECLCRSGQLSRALEISNEMLRLAESTGNRDWVNVCKGAVVEAYICLGDYRTAETLLRPILQSRGSSLPVYTKAHALFLSAWLNIEVGNYDASQHSLDLLRDCSSSEAPCYELELGDILRARISLYTGNVAEAKRLLNAVHATVLRKGWPYQLCLCKLALAEALLVTREDKEAERHAHGAFRLARGMATAYLEAEARILLGKARFNTESDTVPALIHLKEAVDIAERCGSLDLRHRAHYEYAMLQERMGNSESAYWHVKEAMVALTDLTRNVPASFQGGLLNTPTRRLAAVECRRMEKAYGPELDNEENSNLEDQQIRILYRFSRMLINVRDLDAVLDGIVSHALTAMDCQLALLALEAQPDGSLMIARSRGWEKQDSVLQQDLLTDPLVVDAFASLKPFVSTDTSADLRLCDNKSPLSRLGGRVLCGPMTVCGKSIGLLFIAARKPVGYLNESQFSMFASICNLAAIAIDTAITQQQLIAENIDLRQHSAESDDAYAEIIGSSEAVRALKKRMAVAASSHADVLICGESGTGKELVARALYRTGGRSKGPLIAVDCGSLSDTLFEAELFGHRRGAFTGATENRVGLFEAADKGVLFLDEVSNLPLKLQGKLLRALQEREVRRLGEAVTRKVDVQIIAATNRDLAVEVARSRFREDLFYRLQGMQINVPPLRERVQDIPALAQLFLKNCVEIRGIEKRLSREAVSALCKYRFPGNVRELKSVIEDSYYSCDSVVIGADALPIVVSRARGPEHPNRNPDELIQLIGSGKGDFESLVKRPFLARQFGTTVLREVIQLALRQGDGRYRDAFRVLRIPSSEYAATMQFLKRHQCYLDFRVFRRKSAKGRLMH